MNDTNPDYVVVGETKNYNYTMLETAVALVRRGTPSFHTLLLQRCALVYDMHMVVVCVNQVLV